MNKLTALCLLASSLVFGQSPAPLPAPPVPAVTEGLTSVTWSGGLYQGDISRLSATASFKGTPNSDYRIDAIYATDCGEPTLYMIGSAWIRTNAQGIAAVTFEGTNPTAKEGTGLHVPEWGWSVNLTMGKATWSGYQFVESRTDWIPYTDHRNE